jgi:hypothetical protein
MIIVYQSLYLSSRWKLKQPPPQSAAILIMSASIRARSLILAGMPMPKCNLITGNDQRPMGRVDLVYLAYKLIIECESDQHRTDRGQWNRDIDRQEDFARDHWMLIRVTSERARWPRQIVRAVYEALKVNGYDGPEPQYNELWMSLFDWCASTVHCGELARDVAAHAATL